MRAGCQVNTLEHSDTVNSVDFSPDGTQIVSGSDDGLLKIFSVPWDAATGAKVSSFVGMRRGWVGAGGCLGWFCIGTCTGRRVIRIGLSQGACHKEFLIGMEQ
jgi:WD40 repeat protein